MFRSTGLEQPSSSRGYEPHLLTILFVILAGTAFFYGLTLAGHDSLQYHYRTLVFYHGLTEGEWLPRWSQEISGYGEPFFSFNPPLFYYIASAIHATGIPVIVSVNIACLVFLYLCAVAMYFFTRAAFDSVSALVATIAYVYAPYTLLDLFVRAAYSEFSAFSILPFVFLSFYRLSQKESARWFVASSLSMTLLLLSNNPASLIISLYLSLFLVALSVLRKKLRTAVFLFSALAVGLMIPAFFWLPSFVERKFIHIHRLLDTPYLNYKMHFVALLDLLYSPWGYSFGVGKLSFQIGPLHILAVIFSSILFFARWRKKFTPDQLFLIGAALITVPLTIVLATKLSLFLWNQIVFLQYMQFPFRFLMMMSFATAFLFAPAIYLFKGSSKRQRLIGSVAILVVFLMNRAHAWPFGYFEVSENDITLTKIVRNREELTTVGEYRPIWSNADPPQSTPTGGITVLEGECSSKIITSRSSLQEFKVSSASGCFIRINTHYFPGWQIQIDGTPAKVGVEKQFGFMALRIPTGNHTVRAEFKNTRIRRVAGFVSLAGVVFTFAFVISARRLFPKPSE